MSRHSAWISLTLPIIVLTGCNNSAPIADRDPATIPLQLPDVGNPAASIDDAQVAAPIPSSIPTTTPTAIPDASLASPEPSPASTPDTVAQHERLEPGEIRLDPDSRVSEFSQFNCTDASQLRYTLSQISSLLAEAANKFPRWLWQCENTSAVNQVLGCFPELTEQLLDVLETRSGELVAQLRATNVIFCEPAR